MFTQPSARTAAAAWRLPAALLLAAFLLAVLWTLLHAPAADAGRYTVAQCDPRNRAYPDAGFERRNPGDYSFGFRCEEDEDGNALQVRTMGGAMQNRFGKVWWAAPPTAGIVGVSVEARMRSNEGHEARLSFEDANGNEVGRIATGKDSPAAFEAYGRQLTDTGRARFSASLHCAPRSGCKSSDKARNWIRDVRLTIDDRTAPSTSLAGPLTGGGWLRGGQGLGVTATDAGSGVADLEVEVNGVRTAPSQSFACTVIAGTTLASRTRPCPGSKVAMASLDTTRAPFVDGRNTISACARDFGSGGSRGCRQAVAHVDNDPPKLAFLTTRDPEQPELIRASARDGHSGVRLGAISYRPLGGGAWRELPTSLGDGRLEAEVDSTSEPPGRYLFRASGVDVAGNQATTSRRTDGTEMVLTFPLRERTVLGVQIAGAARATAGYGEQPTLSGVLRGAGGAPVAGRRIEVVETFAEGSTLRPLGHGVETDSTGRFEVELAAGPSRVVSARFAGTKRYLPSQAEGVTLRVRGSASFEPFGRRIRAGRRILFQGQVGMLGAERSQGKVVELQVRGGGIRRFRTVKQAFRTDPRGRWSIRYGFDRFYRERTRFQFRVKVTKEGSWPYLAPSLSRTRPLIVLPRRRR